MKKIKILREKDILFSRKVKRLKKDEKGITLIALVITIIVLLILAGVSIMMLAGDNSILKQAANTKEKTAEATVREEVEIAYQAVLTDLYSKEIPQNEVITKLGEELGVTVTGDSSNYNLTYKGYDMTISRTSGKVSVASTNDTEPAKKIKWIYEENADGNIEITGMDLSEYGDSFVVSEADYKGTFSLGIDVIEVPSQINGKRVVKVDLTKSIVTPSNYPIMGGDIDILDVKSIMFGNTIEEISSSYSNGYYVAFTNCEEIALSQNLITIGSSAFSGYSSLSSINIPTNVTSIGNYAFAGCSSLSSINIPTSVTSIGDSAFSYCNDITINFNNGKNSELTIPSDKWGASKIMINGVEYNP